MILRYQPPPLPTFDTTHCNRELNLSSLHSLYNLHKDAVHQDLQSLSSLEWIMKPLRERT